MTTQPTMHDLLTALIDLLALASQRGTDEQQREALAFVNDVKAIFQS